MLCKHQMNGTMEIKNTKPPYEIYKKNGKQWVKFEAHGKQYDMSSDEALTALAGIGLLLLALGLCIALALDNHKK